MEVKNYQIVMIGGMLFMILAGMIILEGTHTKQETRLLLLFFAAITIIGCFLIHHVVFPREKEKENEKGKVDKYPDKFKIKVEDIDEDTIKAKEAEMKEIDSRIIRHIKSSELELMKKFDEAYKEKMKKKDDSVKEIEEELYRKHGKVVDRLRGVEDDIRRLSQSPLGGNLKPNKTNKINQTLSTMNQNPNNLRVVIDGDRDDFSAESRQGGTTLPNTAKKTGMEEN